jgi:hypothetical protein
VGPVQVRHGPWFAINPEILYWYEA